MYYMHLFYGMSVGIEQTRRGECSRMCRQNTCRRSAKLETGNAKGRPHASPVQVAVQYTHTHPHIFLSRFPIRIFRKLG